MDCDGVTPMDPHLKGSRTPRHPWPSMFAAGLHNLLFPTERRGSEASVSCDFCPFSAVWNLSPLLWISMEPLHMVYSVRGRGTARDLLELPHVWTPCDAVSRVLETLGALVSIERIHKTCPEDLYSIFHVWKTLWSNPLDVSEVATMDLTIFLWIWSIARNHFLIEESFAIWRSWE